MAYNNMKKQKSHVKKLHEGLGNQKSIIPIKSPKVSENEVFVVNMPSNHRKTSWLDKLITRWL